MTQDQQKLNEAPDELAKQLTQWVNPATTNPWKVADFILDREQSLQQSLELAENKLAASELECAKWKVYAKGTHPINATNIPPAPIPQSTKDQSDE